MIAVQRWQQVSDLDSLNPYTRIRTLPAYGPNGSSGNGNFYFNPVSIEGIQQLAGQLGSPNPMTVAKIFGGIGLVSGLAYGVLRLWGH